MRERQHPVRRNALRTLVACLLLAAAAAGPPGLARASGPGPSARDVHAAAGQVSNRAAELSTARVQLAAANARLASLRVQAEVVIERLEQRRPAQHVQAVIHRSLPHTFAHS